jgi:hypothetical protein
MLKSSMKIRFFFSFDGGGVTFTLPYVITNANTHRLDM